MRFFKEKTVRVGPVPMSALTEQEHPGAGRSRRVRVRRSEEEPQPGSIQFGVLPFPVWAPPVSEAVWVFPA